MNLVHPLLWQLASLATWSGIDSAGLEYVSASPVLCESLLDTLSQGQLTGTAHSRQKTDEDRSASWLCC